MSITRLIAVTLFSFALVPTAARADEPYRITKADVIVVCPLTIGGEFEAKTNNMSGDITPAGGGVIKGALAVDLNKLDTGISLRNRHLRNNYLETQKGPNFSTAKLENIRVERLPGKSTFRGLFTLHGQQREVVGTADVQQNGKGYRVEATFPLKISEFQIPEPTYLGVGVKDDITVRVNLSAEPLSAVVGTSGKP